MFLKKIRKKSFFSFSQVNRERERNLYNYLINEKEEETRRNKNNISNVMFRNISGKNS